MKSHERAGFSLIETMVVVTIITVLAALGVPNYLLWQRRSAQAEAEALLSGYHQAAQATFSAAHCYPGSFPGIGYRVMGTLGYRIQAADNTATCQGYAISPPAVGASTPCTDTISDTVPANCLWNNTDAAELAAPTEAYGISVTDSSYLIWAGADLGGDVLDEWTMTYQRNMVNVHSGL